MNIGSQSGRSYAADAAARECDDRADAARRMAGVLAEAHLRGLETVALYGAGAHTAKVVESLFHAPVRIAAFVDDDSRQQGQMVFGWDVVTPEQAIALGIKAIILNSDRCEAQLFEQSGVFEEAGIPVLRLYADRSSSASAPTSVTAIEQAMAGSTPLSQGAIQTYWRSRGASGASAENAPDQYTTNVLWSQMLADWLQEAGVEPTDSILELGCNIGRNLAVLNQRGFHELNGIEINPHAVAAMRQYYPDTSKRVEVTIGPLEKVLPGVADHAHEVVFSMAVLEHVHPDSDAIFDHIVRVAGRFILTIEDEGTVTPRHFARDYRAVFESRGCRQVRVLEFNQVSTEAFNLAGLSHGHVARLFEV
jgi:SAM-dependent methyltransferase